MGLSEGRKSFKIGLAVLIQYRRVADSQLPSQPRCRSKYRAYVIRIRRAGKKYRRYRYETLLWFLILQIVTSL